MPKIKRPQIAGPDYDDDDRDEAPAPRSSARARVDARNIPYSVAWFRDRIATYALGTIICGAAMVTLAAWMGGSLGAFGQRMNSGFDVIARWAGISVDKVNVCARAEPEMELKSGACVGVDPVLEAKVKEKADVRVGGNILMTDPFAIRARVEEIDAVGEGAVSVRRMWPDRIDITVEQRQAVALYQKVEGGDWSVIDQSGRVFAEADPTKYVGLPHVIGDGADEAAATLVSAVSQFPDLANRLESAHRISGRRWNIKFKGHADAVVFPDDSGLLERLRDLNLQQAQSRILDLPVTQLDARHPKYIAVRPMAGAPEATPPGGA